MMTNREQGRERTDTIAGHELTLTAGVRYLAERPFVGSARRRYDVTIRVNERGQPLGPVARTVRRLDFARADALVRAFNNGEPFDGRVWEGRP
jgi:hypothetical protein